MARKTNKLDCARISKSVVEKLTSAFDIDEIILFGSFAKGNADENSDVDIAVISPELKPSGIMYENVRTLKEKSGILEPGLQLFGFESKTFYEEKFFDVSFIKEIKDHGKVLFRKLKTL
jgi:predicted nucleotidyltransferase